MGDMRLGSRGSLLSLAAYVAMLGVSIAIFLWIRSAGSRLVPSVTGEVSFGKTVTARLDVLPHVLLALVLTIALARLVGWLFDGFTSLQ